MPIIIAHEETCDIIVVGATQQSFVQSIGTWRAGERAPQMTVPTVCTCGGVQFQVIQTWDGMEIRRVKKAATPDA